MVLTSIPTCQHCWHLNSFGGELMTIEPTPVRKTPWLAIGLGALGILCLCAIVICLAILAFFTPIRASTTIPEVMTEVVIEPTIIVETLVPAEETQASPDAPIQEAAPAGTPVDIGDNMTLTIHDVTRP